MADTYRRYCRDLLLRHEIFLNWEEMEGVIAVVYTLWAIYSGYKVMSRRTNWQQMNVVVKVILTVVVGYVVGAFYLLYLILKLLGFLEV